MAYAGRDLPMPASPAESLDHWERETGLSVGQDRGAALALIAKLEVDQAQRRAQIARRVLDLVEKGTPEASLDVDALWTVGGSVGYQEEDQRLSEIAETWREVRETYVARVSELLR